MYDVEIKGSYKKTKPRIVILQDIHKKRETFNFIQNFFIKNTQSITINFPYMKNNSLKKDILNYNFIFNFNELANQLYNILEFNNIKPPYIFVTEGLSFNIAYFFNKSYPNKIKDFICIEPQIINQFINIDLAFYRKFLKTLSTYDLLLNSIILNHSDIDYIFSSTQKIIIYTNTNIYTINNNFTNYNYAKHKYETFKKIKDLNNKNTINYYYYDDNITNYIKKDIIDGIKKCLSCYKKN
jgi:hypothetical protein